MRPKISLLHATYRRSDGPQEVKSAWLSYAAHPESIEYVFAMDSDDFGSINQTVGDLRVLTPPLPGWVTTVQNWNAAAKVAKGDFLMVIADDLFPPPDWDSTLLQFASRLDPLRKSFAIKITDSPHEDDVLLRHPVVSRAFYTRHGLFSDQFHGMYCDNDITTRAFWRSSILDGRTLVLTHRNPLFDGNLSRSESQERIASDVEYAYGRTTYRQKWPDWMRSARVRLVPIKPGTPVRPFGLFRHSLCSRSVEALFYVRRRSLRLARLTMHPAALIERLRAGRSGR